MKKYGLITSAVVACLAGVFYYLALQFPVSELDDLGPAFWPKILCVALMGLAVLLAVESITKYGKEDVAVQFIATAWQKTTWKAVGILVLFAVLIKLLGFYPAAALFLPAVLWLFGERNKKVILLMHVGTLDAVYIVFKVLLRVQLPSSMFF